MSALAAAPLAAAQAPICPDRPGKASAVCTVPLGRWQVESSLVDWSLTKSGDERTELTSLASTTVKYGWSERSDIEVALTPYVRLTSTDSFGSHQASSFGDLIVRFKQRLTGDDAGIQLAVFPFIKLPAATRQLGNGKIEGGLTVPLSFTLVGPVTMTLGAELDLLANADGHGTHVAVVNVVNFSAPLGRRLTLSGELWGNVNGDAGGTVRQASADAAIAYAVSNDFQLDVGGNFGLSRNTPDVELYGGMSVRF